ncbi:hypothetical protein FQN50_007198 [Emmonsiellopsis sp. PD_5]|nr:hypothetical protein FQN50_007198 [Emmonsiellopsis sp. PD_5]
MADSLCGPSNALQNFQKHTSVDRTLQQDRLLSRQSPAQGFRSHNPNEGSLDPEFSAFEAGHSGPPLSGFQHPLPLPQQAHRQSPAFNHAESPAWASDFQNLHIAGPSQPVPQQQLQPKSSSGGWQHEFMHPGHQTPQMQTSGFTSRFPQTGTLQNPGFAYNDYMPAQTFTQPAPGHEQMQERLQADKSDQSAFEMAFADVRAEVEVQEQNVQEEETSEQPIIQETIRIGSDTIQPQADGVNESDELAKTAGQLLDSVSHDQSEKFKGSNFLALMRQLRDREVTVEGDEFRQTAQPLHPGGPYYPEQSLSPQPAAGISTDTASSGNTYRSIRSSRYDTSPSPSRPRLHQLPLAQPASQPHVPVFHPLFRLRVLVARVLWVLPAALLDVPLNLQTFEIADLPCSGTTSLALSGNPGQSGSPSRALPSRSRASSTIVENDDSYTAPPPHSPTSGPSSNPPSPCPPPFSSLYSAPDAELDRIKASVTESAASCLPAFAPTPPFDEPSPAFSPAPAPPVVEDTKAALSRDKKGESSGKGLDDGEPPPPYTEGSSPLESFTYVMAAAGGAASIITQVQQTGGPPLNTLGDIGGDEHITLDLRGTRFTLSRDELLTLPEFVLLSLFPNGLLPDGHMGTFHEGDVYPVDYDPASLQYMLDFFRSVAQSIPSSTPSPTTSPEGEYDPMQNSTRDMLQGRAGIIVLREDLDFYVIPPAVDIDHPEMIEVKRAAGRALLKQDGIFSGLRKSDEAGTTEQHLIEMLTAGGFNHDDRWGHRAGEPNKAVVCSLALAKLRTDIRGDLANNNAVGMAQKLLLFWRKPARRCWWEGVELENVEGVEGKLKVWIRRVWTLEMSVIGLR